MSLNGQTPVAYVMTRDRAVAEPFYRDVLGLPFVRDDGHCAEFDLAGVSLRITEAGDHTPSPHPVLGWQVDDLVTTATALAERGVSFTIYEGMGQDELGIWTSPDGKSKIAFFNDPDGNALAVTEG